MTLVIYISEFLFTAFCLYNYLIHVHMNGRMLDVYKRLHGTSEDFFCPHDFEVTYAEIAYICEKARKWTHPRGKHGDLEGGFRKPVDGISWGTPTIDLTPKEGCMQVHGGVWRSVTTSWIRRLDRNADPITDSDPNPH